MVSRGPRRLYLGPRSMHSAPHALLAPTREQLLHALYEAAELEHNLMCTYLYAAFSLKQGEAEGLTEAEAPIVAGWRRTILDVAIEEMGHLVAVWNITAALGGAPRIGRTNFPLDPGYLPAGVVVRLAPFNEATLQHFVHLERPEDSNEPDGQGFPLERTFMRAIAATRLTPMAIDYATVGAFYSSLSDQLRAFVAQVGEDGAFCGDPSTQLSRGEMDLDGVRPVTSLETALAALEAIVLQGEGAPRDTADSHFAKFIAIRSEHEALTAGNAAFVAAHPVATNPVLRRPPRPEGRVWIEDERAAATVDLANAAYGLMLRLLAHAYATPGPSPAKTLTVDLGIGLMRAVALLAERAARLPAGPSNPACHAGVSFTTLRDSAALPRGAGAARFFIERFEQLANGAAALASAESDARLDGSARLFSELSSRAARGLDAQPSASAKALASPRPVPPAAAAVSSSTVTDGVESAEGKKLTILFEAKRCIHARHCVTGAPDVFVANVEGPWLHPDATDEEALVSIAHACPSGAIRYVRKDGPHESAPPVNLASLREAGPYAFRGDVRIDGGPPLFRATLCRCGASKNKPFCDGSHQAAGFTASGEPPSREIEKLPVRNGPLSIDPEQDGPLRVQGNLEITSGTGRVIARVTSARLCRCGASTSKPFCDGSHKRIGFTSA